MNINKEYYIDTLTILSCIAVVYLHANGIFWTHPSGRLWLTSNVIESFFYFAVPVFFMISGATLLEYRQRYSTLTFIKSQIYIVYIFNHSFLFNYSKIFSCCLVRAKHKNPFHFLLLYFENNFSLFFCKIELFLLCKLLL